jgi:transcriptional regulator with XRE-family HTH domain
MTNLEAMTTTDTPKPHVGKNMKRVREMLGVKQESLAVALGEDWTQSKISQLEQKEHIEREILEQVAQALRVTPEAIQNFSEEKAYLIASNFHDNSIAIANNCSFNPLDKVVELYERLLVSEKEKAELYKSELELLRDKKK